jgi:hypothetical protein
MKGSGVYQRSTLVKCSWKRGQFAGFSFTADRRKSSAVCHLQSPTVTPSPELTPSAVIKGSAANDGTGPVIDLLLAIERRRGKRGQAREVAGTKIPQVEGIGQGEVAAQVRTCPRWCSLSVPSAALGAGDPVEPRLHALGQIRGAATCHVTAVDGRVGYVREGVLRSYWFKEDIRGDFGIWSRLRSEGAAPGNATFDTRPQT